MIEGNANSMATNITIGNTTAAYKYLDTTLGINPSSGLDKFIYYTNLQQTDGPQILYNINKAFVKG